MLPKGVAGVLVLCVARWTVVMANTSQFSGSSLVTNNVERDARLPTPQLIAAYGYPAETHYVKTQDGYILALHRIPGKRTSARLGNKVVLVQHGLLCSSADWVVLGPGRALAYALSDAGYDVWLGNARGNTYSKRHEKNLPKEQYWNFSFHEMGVYDLPAVIDYILETTKTNQINYVGHSMGTTMFYVMASERPEYNNKIRIMISLAPIAYLSHINNNFLRISAQMGNHLGWFLNMVGVNEFQPTKQLRHLARAALCRNSSRTQGMCSNALFLMAGIDLEQINKSLNVNYLQNIRERRNPFFQACKTLLPVILGHTPAGTSTKVFIHFSQIINSGKFQQIDRGYQENLQHYRISTPPVYNLSQITAPVVFFMGDNDMYTNNLDIDKLHKQLRRVVGRYRVPHHKFNHLDFMWGKDARVLVYNDVIHLMDKW